MSLDSESESSEYSLLNSSESEEKKHWSGNPLYVNAIIFGVYSLFMLFAFWQSSGGGNYDNLGSAILYAAVISIHVIINLFLTLIFLFINKTNAALCLLSAFSIAIIGFSACAGMGSLSSGHHKTPIENREEKVKLDSTMKAETDSLRKANIRSKRIQDSTDSVSHAKALKNN